MERWSPSTKAEVRLLKAEAREADVRSLGLLVLVGAIAAGRAALRANRHRSLEVKPQNPAAGPAPLAIAGLHGAASLLALSVFADSAIEHSRGRYKNPGMYAPVLIAGLVVGANAKALFATAGSTTTRDGLHATSVALGAA